MTIYTIQSHQEEKTGNPTKRKICSCLWNNIFNLLTLDKQIEKMAEISAKCNSLFDHEKLISCIRKATTFDVREVRNAGELYRVRVRVSAGQLRNLINDSVDQNLAAAKRNSSWKRSEISFLGDLLTREADAEFTFSYNTKTNRIAGVKNEKASWTGRRDWLENLIFEAIKSFDDNLYFCTGDN